MALNTQSLFDTALREVGGGSGSDTFNKAFINAVNCSLNELSDNTDLTVRHANITSVGVNIATLNVADWYILYAGVIYNLIRMGQRPSDPKLSLLVYQDSDKRWQEGKGNYQTRLLNAYQADPDNHVTKLGSVEEFE
jgi:hypothetical protein